MYKNIGQRAILHSRFASCSFVGNFLTPKISIPAGTSGSAPLMTKTSIRENRRPAGRHANNSGGSRGPSSFRKRSLEDIVVPLSVKIPNTNLGMSSADDIGSQLTGTELSKVDINHILGTFASKPQIRHLCREQGLTDRLFHQAAISFRTFCVEANPLPTELHIVIADIVRGSGVAEDVYPFFLEHSRKVFPHLEYMDELKHISDLTKPHVWYKEARSIQRKIIFHAGPTNSGKTHQALQRFMTADTGVYCGPLKLLANEVYYRCQGGTVPCDLITGDDRKYAVNSEEPAKHISCTMEMVDTSTFFEVAVIDEIQMLRDVQRGWAWTRALLGVYAEEVHVCGEPATLDLLNEILLPTGETVEVRNYQRMTPLKLSDKSLESSFRNVSDGDCVVCFNKNDIFTASRAIEQLGKQAAVIYGSLPPATKLAQAKKFNDPADPCKVMVATDAVGMGLNLSIKRIVFYSLMKPIQSLEGGRETTSRELIPTAQALQIGGRAGRYGTDVDEGEVTTFKASDLQFLRKIWHAPVEAISQAGLRPTADQIEMFAMYLKDATLSNLLSIFVSLCSVDDSNYFMCIMEDTIFLAELIEHIELPLRVKYTFCLAPINKKAPKVCNMFVKYTRKVSRNEPVTYDWLCHQLGWPFEAPQKISELVDLEQVFDMFDVYLWLGYRFKDMFPHMDMVRQMQSELDVIIQDGVANIVQLLNTEIEEQQKRPGGLSKEFARMKELSQMVTRKGTGQTTASKGVGLGDERKLKKAIKAEYAQTMAQDPMIQHFLGSKKRRIKRPVVSTTKTTAPSTEDSINNPVDTDVNTATSTLSSTAAEASTLGEKLLQTGAITIEQLKQLKQELSQEKQGETKTEKTKLGKEKKKRK